MHKEIDVLTDHVPSPQEVAEYEKKWNTLVDYVNQENALNKLLKYFRNRDGFMAFKESNLKEYSSYYNIIQSFKSFYGLQEFSVKQIDKYLWQLGKEAFNRYK